MPRIAWFSSVSSTPPTRSAVFTQTLFPHFPQHWEVELFVDDLGWKALCLEDGGLKDFCRYPFFHYLQAFLRDCKNPFDYFVYQSEGSSACAFVNNIFPARPGIVYCHDFQQFCSENFLQDNTVTSLFVVSDEDAIEPIKQKAVGNPVQWSPFPLLPRHTAQIQQKRKTQRQKLGLSDTDVIISITTSNPREDRLYQLCTALQLLAKGLETNPLPQPYKGGNIFLLWIVSTASDEQKARDFRDRFLVIEPSEHFTSQHILIQQAETVEALTALIDTSDVVTATCSNFFRGISLTTLLALAGGIPTIVGLTGFGLGLPREAAMKVHLGAGEQEALERTILEVLREERLREVLKMGSQDYIELVCSPTSVVADLKGLMEKYDGFLRTQGEQKRQAYHRTQQRLIWQMEKDFLEKDIGDPFLNEPPLLNLSRNFLRKAVRDFGWGKNV